MSELRWILLGLGVLLLLGIYLWGRKGRGQAAPGAELHAPVRAERSGAALPAETPVSDAGDRVSSQWDRNEWTDTVHDLPEIRLDDPAAFADPLEPTLADDDPILPPAAEMPPPARSHMEVAEPASPPTRAVPEAAPAGQGSSQRRVPARTPPGDTRKIVTLRLSAPPESRYDGSRLRAAFEQAGLAHGKYGIFHAGETPDGSTFSVASMVEPGTFDLKTMDDNTYSGITLFALLPGPLPGLAACDQLVDCARLLEAELGGELQDERGMRLTTQRIVRLRDEVADFDHLLGRSAADTYS